jgi:hypothetical protein
MVVVKNPFCASTEIHEVMEVAPVRGDAHVHEMSLFA